MTDFAQEAFVKIVGISGDYRYGFIQEVTEKGFHLLICMHDEGDSALGYEAASGVGPSPDDWDMFLSDSEKAIVPLLAQNLSTKEIGVALNLSPVTVRAHIRTLRLKLQLDNRQQLIVFSQGMNKSLEEKE